MVLAMYLETPVAAQLLQCFLNGSLARENIKDRFGYSDQFTNVLNETDPGCNGNYMLPFSVPLYDGINPILKGSSNFEIGEALN